VKQTLLEIKRRTDITTKSIAERARLPIADVYVVETGGFTSRDNAQKVVTAFNQLSGMRVMLDDIKLYERSNNAKRDVEDRIQCRGNNGHSEL
jgi:hypothetical protein